MLYHNDQQLARDTAKSFFMTPIALPMASPNLLKRIYDVAEPQCLGNRPHNHAEVTEGLSTPPEPTMSQDQSQSQLVAIEAEHNQPNLPLSTTSGLAAGGTLVQATSATTSTTSASKRRKLTSAEQEAKQLEKEIKDRQKADEKAKKEDEKRVRDIEREEKRKLKEAQTKLREDEKKKREEEKNKKEKACDCHLKNFFADSHSLNYD